MAVYGELGQLPVNLWWKERTLKFWNRIYSDDAPALLKAAKYLSLYNASCGGKCWVSNVATLSNTAGYATPFSEFCVFDLNMQNAIMCTYRDQFIQRRHANLEREHSLTGQGGNKLRSYRLFKKEFGMEPNITSAALRVSMTRLRVGCHSLEIERGRYHKPRSVPVSQRLCHKSKSVEDEKHFLCECSKYVNLRNYLEQVIQAIFPGYKWLSSEQKFVYLLASDNKMMQWHIYSYRFHTTL